MAKVNKSVSLVVGLAVMALVAALLVPIVMGPLAGASSTTVEQDVDETYTLTGDLNATVTGVTDGTSATYTVSAGGDSVTGETVNVNESSTVTVDGTDVTLSPTEATSTGATTEYNYPTTYGWGPGATALWLVLPVLIVLALFLWFVKVGTSGF